MAAGRESRTAVEDADVVQPKKAALKEIIAKAVFTVHPPTEVEHQLGKRTLEEINIAFPRSSLFRPVHKYGGPSMHRRIHIAEVPLIGRDLAGWVEEELLQHQIKLSFSKVGVNRSQGNGVKGQIPRCIPRIFPLVEHGDDVGIQH